MSHYRTRSFTFACLLLGLSLVWGLNRHSIRLKITRQAIEQGKPVVFFQLEGAGNSAIFNVSRIGATLHDYGFVPIGPDYSGPAPNFWAPSEGDNPLASQSQTKFGVLTPTNSRVWKLRVVLRSEDIHSWKHARIILGCCKGLINQPLKPFSMEILQLWNMPMERFETVESNPIAP
jgi:hypothetical protein